MLQEYFFWHGMLSVVYISSFGMIKLNLVCFFVVLGTETENWNFDKKITEELNQTTEKRKSVKLSVKHY